MFGHSRLLLVLKNVRQQSCSIRTITKKFKETKLKNVSVEYELPKFMERILEDSRMNMRAEFGRLGGRSDELGDRLDKLGDMFDKLGSRLDRMSKQTLIITTLLIWVAVYIKKSDFNSSDQHLTSISKARCRESPNSK
uniref:t-SNARE coiled-coil homology domain-containing protein n=1 Tax=Meloidogyne floridensis TaxID=298350 RepID=A0A915NRS1_9BILA